MKTSAIVAPIHNLKFKYGLEFIRTYNLYYEDTDIFLVFSSEDEAKQFDKLSSTLKYNTIIWNEGINFSKPITQKKIFGLDYVFKNTAADKIATVDADSIFIRHLDYDNGFKNILENKKIYASKSNLVADLMSKNASFFSKEDQIKIRDKTENYSLYFWFNEIPVYDKDSFYSFIDYINYHKIKHEIKYHHFDFMIYAFYLLSKDLLEIKEIPNTQNKTKNESFIERQADFSPDQFEKSFTFYNPMWIKNLISENMMKNVFIQIHRDR